MKDLIKKVFDRLPRDKWPFSVYYSLNDTITDLNNKISEKDYYLKTEGQKREHIIDSVSFIQRSFKFGRPADILYFHGGSGNHGCEALVRTILPAVDRDNSVLLSYTPEEDVKFGLDREVCTIIPSYLRGTEVGNIGFVPGGIALSIGGDNYCYDGQPEELHRYNRAFNEKGIKTGLIGCSIEPELLDDPDIRKDLEMYSLITARETYTYEKLLEAGIRKNTHLVPDSAFLLDAEETVLPAQFFESRVIGLNLSSMILNSGDRELVRRNIYDLCDHILADTPYSIALIPHVNQDANNDIKILEEIFLHYNQRRVFLVDEADCRKIKYAIGKCSLFMCGRTHASIAAYSSGVPTVVFGYSIKSRGIAKDIFGTEEGYVIDIKHLKDDRVFRAAFDWLDGNKEEIAKNLADRMPGYIETARTVYRLIDDMKHSGQGTCKGIADSRECIGCGNCISECPAGAISTYRDAQQFMQIQVDYTKCVRCGRCETVCPVNHKTEKTYPSECYAAINNDPDERMSSSSGGIFIALALSVLDRGGIVYGAVADGQRVYHARAATAEQVLKLKGSKYQQSDLGNVFDSVAEDLKSGSRVLFTGTPCQIHALTVFLERRGMYPCDDLYCADVICHGVPSPSILAEECINVESASGSKITGIDFRKKEPSWESYSISYKLENGKTADRLHGQDGFMQKFLADTDLRGCCYQCRYREYRSDSDITLGDYWGGGAYHPDYDDHKGISAVMIKTSKGEELFESARDRISAERADIKILEITNPMLIRSPERG